MPQALENCCGGRSGASAEQRGQREQPQALGGQKLIGIFAGPKSGGYWHRQWQQGPPKALSTDESQTDKQCKCIDHPSGRSTEKLLCSNTAGSGDHPIYQVFKTVGEKTLYIRVNTRGEKPLLQGDADLHVKTKLQYAGDTQHY